MIFIAVLVVLVILVIFAYQGSGWMNGNGSCDGFTTTNMESEAYKPYVAMNHHIDSIRGLKHDGYNQTPVWKQPHGLDRYHRSGAHLKPEDIAEAERESWYRATSADNSGTFNTELMQDAHSDTMQYHTANPEIDYSEHITNLVVDRRTKDNHKKWVEEMKPWSGTAMTVDNMDEALEASVHFQGLRRPQAVAQFNQLQVTENDAYTYASNPKFNFKG